MLIMLTLLYSAQPEINLKFRLTAARLYNRATAAALGRRASLCWPTRLAGPILMAGTGAC